MEPMDINGLIVYLKREKNIEVSEKHQYALMNMGYYHGYKGYRYITIASKSNSVYGV